jgi:type I restriction enzyme R subunit
MDEDPAFYKKFSALLEEVIKAFRAQRLADADYLRKVTEIQDAVRNRGAEDVPQALVGRDAAKAYYGVLDEILEAKGGASVVRDRCAATGLHIEELINRRKIVNWTTNQDVQNQMKNDLEDCLHELKDKDGIDITYDEMDRILELCIDIARARERGGDSN